MAMKDALNTSLQLDDLSTSLLLNLDITPYVTDIQRLFHFHERDELSISELYFSIQHMTTALHFPLFKLNRCWLIDKLCMFLGKYQ